MAGLQGFSTVGSLSRLRSGEPFVVLVATERDESAERAWRGIAERLVALDDEQRGGRLGAGPSAVFDPVPVTGGYVFSVDTHLMTTRAVRAIPALVLQEFEAAGSAAARVSVPQASRWLRAFAGRVGLATQVQLYGPMKAWVKAPDARPPGQPPFRAVPWTSDQLEPFTAAAARWVGERGPVTLTLVDDVLVQDVPPAEAARAALLPLSGAGAMCVLYAGDATGDARVVTVSSILGIEVMATDAALKREGWAQRLGNSVEYWRALAPHIFWAGADVTGCYESGHSFGGSQSLLSALTLQDGSPAQTLHHRDTLIPDAYWWQVLSPTHLGQLPKLSEGQSAALDGGRLEVRYGDAEQWSAGTEARAAMRTRARRELAVLIPD
ncbi:hypothetical protein [Motilibacter aurantiacus]|uniref:hypothetical protein n=1 Tax=Motilibacter aurantiacus TaxID=2714955 RepID=UPI00140CC410|nr:hypothetical protein [Motilibacter aurantiacus]NHC43643.1 hypothetical protein [Motilibacter aurantiacus]